MEITLKNYEFASECLIKSYITKSNQFQAEKHIDKQEEKPSSIETPSDSSNVRPWLRGQGARAFSLQGDQ